MSEIVERLRACDCSVHCKSGCIQEKAADEIERLRAVIVRAKDALIDGQSTQWVHGLLVDALHD